MMPTTIGQYEIKYELGAGGFGTVYAAVDLELGRWVAIKALRREVSSNPALVERFRAEAISLAKLNHPNITTLYQLLHPSNEWFLVMELVQGQTLDKVLHRVRRLDIAEALAIIVQTAAGLGYANRMGVIHRDIKPSNLMLTDTGQVKIMDFGIARIRGTQRLTRSGLLGTYAYLAPEQFLGGEGSERSDLYALACVAYEMLSGNIPFDAPTEAEMMRGHLELPPRPLRDIVPNLNPQVSAAIQRALSKDPGARFANVDEFSDALGASSIERQAQQIIRSKVLSRMPPPSHPTTLSDTSPISTGSGSSDGSQGNTPDPMFTSGGKSAFARRMPAIVLIGAVAGVVVAASAIVFQDSLNRDLTPRRAESVNPMHRDPPPAITGRPSDIATGGEINVPGSLSETPESRRSSIFIEPPHPQPTKKFDFLGTEPDKTSDISPEDADALIRQAQGFISAGQITNAEVKLRMAAYPPYNDPRALVVLAHLEDPTQPDRPVSLAPDPGQAARYYKEAEERNDSSSRVDRDRLRRYLQEKANAGDYAAKALLRQNWP